MCMCMYMLLCIVYYVSHTSCVSLTPCYLTPERLGQEYVKTRAIIYGRNNDKKITKYQENIDSAAVELALENPNLLLSRQKLLNLARAKVNEEYDFKKSL